MANILGIIGFGENPAACLLVDGQLHSFCQEERLTRLKNSNGIFPGKSVQWCLENAQLNLQDVDKIAFAWDASLYPKSMFQTYLGQYLKYRGASAKAYRHPSPNADIDNKLYALQTLFTFSPSALKTKIRDGLRSAGLAGEIPDVEFLSHHMCHAYSAYFCSGFDKALVLTVDGSGENKSTQICVAEGDSVREIKSFDIPHSLGWFYAAITAYMGFTPYRDEGKLMGLAALGEARSANNPWVERLRKILKIGPGWYEVDPTYTKFGGHFFHPRFTDGLQKFITEFDPEMPPIAYGEKTSIDGKPASKYLLNRYIDLAWAAQELLEQAVISLVDSAVAETGIRNLCLAGGVAMNCKMNGRLALRENVDALFVQPASSDDGTCIGAAQMVAQSLGDPIKHRLTHTQYGPSYGMDEVRAALRGCKVNFYEVENLEEVVADYLDRGKLVGWHQGAMEFGARALGGRSILANPVDPAIKNKVNNEVKYRESWRPFCPSLPIESAPDYLAPGFDSPFMIVAQDAKEKMQTATPSVVHVDNTVRPQTVHSDVQTRYYETLKRLGELTGHPVSLNTSLNVRSEPIVCSPLDTVRCFFSTGLDVLAMENFIIDKSDL